MHIADAILSLENFPKRVKEISFQAKTLINLRRLLVDNYSILFMLDEEKKTVTITNIIHSSSDIEKRLVARDYS